MQTGAGEKELGRVAAPRGAWLVVTDRVVRIEGRTGTVGTWMPREQVSQVSTKIVAPGLLGWGRRMRITVRGQGTAALATEVKPGRAAQAVLRALGQ